jgi:hypothetical protein
MDENSLRDMRLGMINWKSEIEGRNFILSLKYGYRFGRPVRVLDVMIIWAF